MEGSTPCSFVVCGGNCSSAVVDEATETGRMKKMGCCGDRWFDLPSVVAGTPLSVAVSAAAAAGPLSAGRTSSEGRLLL